MLILLSSLIQENPIAKFLIFEMLFLRLLRVVKMEDVIISHRFMHDFDSIGYEDERFYN